MYKYHVPAALDEIYLLNLTLVKEYPDDQLEIAKQRCNEGSAKLI